MLHDYVKCEEKGYRVIEVDTIYDTETPQKLGIVNINIPAQLQYHDSRDKNFYNYYVQTKSFLVKTTQFLNLCSATD